jgi:pantothenate synthetase
MNDEIEMEERWYEIVEDDDVIFELKDIKMLDFIERVFEDLNVNLIEVN